MTLNRRTLLQAAGTAGLAQLGGIAAAQAADEILLASMYDLSGGLELAGKPMLDTLTMAVEELNAAGGLLGKQIKVISFDTGTNMQLYAQFAQQAALKDKVAVVHGGITSASREVIRPVLDRYKTLYFYDTPYEGGVCDRNIFCPSSTPAQTVDKLVNYACATWGKKGYTLAADYNYGQITSEWVKKYAHENGGEVLATEFFPLDATSFGSTISKLQAAKPDWVMSVLVGGATIAYYRQFAAAGLVGKIPMMSTTFGSGGEPEVLKPDEYRGMLACCNYVDALDTPTNNAFKERFRKRFGPNYPALGELPMSSYQGVHLWAAGVKKAGSIDRMKVIEALESGISIDMPSGKVTIEPGTHHCILDVHLAEYRDRIPTIIKSFPQQPPSDTSAVCDLTKRPNEAKQYVIKAS